MAKHTLSIQSEYLNKLKFLLHAIDFVFCFVAIWLHWITGSILVKKLMPQGQKITRHNYVMSVQDWCYNTATLIVTVTENIVSMKEGNTEVHGGHWWNTEVHGGHWWNTEVHGGHWWNTEVHGDHRWNTEVHGGHRWRNASCTLNLISKFVLLSLGRYLCVWTICPRVYHPHCSLPF